MRGRGSTHTRRGSPSPARDRQGSSRPPTGRAPQRPTRTRRRRDGGLLGRIGLYLLVIVLALVLYGLGALFYASSRITREPVDGLSSGDVYHVLVTGSDSRENLSRRQQQQLSVGRATGGVRTDTIFVLSVKGRRAAMLAFPRDLFVTRCDGSQGRINAATGIGGQSCLVETVSSLSGLPIRHAVQIDFRGFRDVVDAVGGVEVCLDSAIKDRDAGIDLPKGCQTLDGRDGLGYVRVRKIDNDLQRIKRQQQFLQALASEVATPATVLNPFRLYGTAGAMGGALQADDGLSSVDLVRLGLGARGVANGQIAAATVPATDAFIGGASVLEVSEAEADALFEQFRTGAIFDQLDGGDTVAPEDVELVVLNGTSTSGLAAATAEELRGRGYTVAEIGDAPATDTTVVRYPPGQEAQARTVAAQAASSGDIELEEDGGVDVVTLVLGSSSLP
jgi:LCP family protein required for cell wall assembly